MKLTIPRSELKAATAGFSKIVNGNARTLPILGCIRFDTGTIITAQTTDLDQNATYQFIDAQADGQGNMVIPLATLKELVKGADSETLVFESGAEDVNIENHVGEHIVRQSVACMPPQDWPPSQTEIKTQPAAGFLDTYRKLAPFASADQTRRVLNGVCIDVEAKGGPFMVTCDGRRLSRWTLDLPIKKTCVVPISKFLAWTGLTGDERIGASKLGTWLGVQVGRWVYQVKLVEGVYPNWAQVIPYPNDCKPCLYVADADIPALQAFVRSLQPKSERVTVGPTPAGTVHVTGTADGKTMNLDLPGSRYEVDYSLMVTSSFLMEALAAGFREFRHGGLGCPLYCENGTGIHVLMPWSIGKSTPVPVPESKPDSQPAATVAAQNLAVPADAGQAAQEIKVNEQTKPEPTALDKMQAAYEVAKSEVREASQALGEVADAIKLAIREDRQHRTEVENVRAGLQKLQAIKV